MTGGGAGEAPIRVVVVDDQAMVRDGLVAVLETAPDIAVVGQAGDGDEAVRLAAELGPDVVVMDIRMPRVDGLEATRRIVAARGDEGPPRVLVLTTFDLDEYVYEALGAGASGFLLKDGRPPTSSRGCG
ncbi:MAG: response regulator transcription factor [Actinomycetales bacterium]